MRHPRFFAACLALMLVVGFLAGTVVLGSAEGASEGIQACAQGEALLAKGRVPAAEKAFEKALEVEAKDGHGSGLKCGKAGLAIVEKSHPCAAAEALLGAGQTSEATMAYTESLKAQPTSSCAAKGVTTASDPSFWEELETVSKDAVTALGAAVLAIAALIALALILIKIQSSIPGLKDQWPVSRIRQPTVQVEPFDDSALSKKLGIATAALVRRWVELRPGDHGVKLVSGEATTEETWIKKVSEMGEKGKLAAALIGLFLSLLPRRHVKVSGELQPAAKSGGPGISLELHRKLGSAGNAALWADGFSLPLTDGEEVDTLRKLVVPAAAWLSHRVTTETGGTPLAAGDAMSWALFKTGLQWHLDGERAKAVELYAAAIHIDAANYGARTNLGLIHSGFGNHAVAVDLFGEALEILEIE